MKKYVLLVVSAVTLAFASCSSNNEVEINYQVNITINPSTVKSAFKGYFVNNQVHGIDMYKDAELLISAFIYDKDGMFVEKKEFYVDDYTSRADFSITVPEIEKYTIVATTYSVLKNGQASSYKVENYNERINNLKITQSDPTGISYYSNWGMLGIKVQEVYSNGKYEYIDVEPASVLVAVQYENIHAYDEVGVYKHMIIFENNDYAQIRDNYGFYNPYYDHTLSNNAGHTNSIDVAEYDGNSVFEILYLLPREQMYMEACLYSEEQRINYSDLRRQIGADPSFGYSIVDIQAGNEYVFTVDCSNLAIIVDQLSTSKNVKVDSSEIKVNSNPGKNPQSSNVMTFIN